MLLASTTTDQNCPDNYNECEKNNYMELQIGQMPTIVSLVSCSLSVVGAILTILPYLLWKDIRTGLRKIITFLAIADLITALGYIVGSVNYLIYYKRIEAGKKTEYACTKFDEVCQIQSYITSWSSLSSFWWTSILALYIYWTIVKGEFKVVNKLFPIYHILAWGSPLLSMVPLLGTGSLGYSRFAAESWCFIKGDHGRDYSLSFMTIVKTLAGGKAVEIGTYIWVIALYTIIHYNIRKKKTIQRNAPGSAGIGTLLKQVEKKLFFIPVGFIILRMWGTIQFFFSIYVFNHSDINDNDGCVPKWIYYTYMVLGILQSIGDGAQGWLNAILYIFWSPKIRTRLIVIPLGYLCYEIATHVMSKPKTTSLFDPRTSQSTSRLFVRTSNQGDEGGHIEEDSTALDDLSPNEKTPLVVND